MFFRVMLLLDLKSAPFAVQFCTVPPLPAVVPVPFTVKEPVLLLKLMPVAAPLLEILVNE
jgi:hypothetical protein